MSVVIKWFERSWNHLYIFAKLNNIKDYELSSQSPYLDESNEHYLLDYIREIDSLICPHGDGKFKFFKLLSRWLIYHEQWMCGMAVFK